MAEALGMDDDLEDDLEAVEAGDTEMGMEKMKVGMEMGMSQGMGMTTEVEMGKEDEDDDMAVMELPTLAHARRELTTMGDSGASLELTNAMGLSYAKMQPSSMTTMSSTVSLVDLAGR